MSGRAGYALRYATATARRVFNIVYDSGVAGWREGRESRRGEVVLVLAVRTHRSAMWLPLVACRFGRRRSGHYRVA
jgi:hypothetical protein